MIETVLTLAMVLSGAVMGVFFHEATHFITGLALGIVEDAGIAYDSKLKLPIAFYVGLSQKSYLTSLLPLFWIIPFAVIEPLSAEMPIYAYLHLYIAFGIAWGGVLVSDLPAILGIYNPASGKNIEYIQLIDYAD